jgi:hypothetical protein
MADTISTLAAKLRPHWLRDVANVTVTAAGGGTGGVTDHGDLSGLFDDDHPQYLTPVRADVRYLTASRQVIAGSGLTGGGALTADVTLNVGAGAGITVAADAVALATPSTLHVSSTNDTIGGHTHAITSSAAPGASASILATTGAGLLTLQNGAFVQAAQSSATFASGFAGSGWRADYGITTASRASMETDDLTVRGRMRVYELLIQQIRATNGSVIVSSSSKAQTVSASTNPLWTVNGTQLTFNGANATLTCTTYTITTSTSGEDAASKRTYHGFLTGDITRAQQVEWNGSAFAGVIQSDLEVTSVANLYSYNAVLVAGNAAAVGYDYVRIGSVTDSSRRGVVYLTSDDSAAPFIDIVDNISYHSDWNTAGKIKARLGKLTGISDADFGGALSGYGLYSQNVYLKGNIYATSGIFNGTVYASAGSFTGAVTATSGSFTGSLTSSSGTIGGWTLGATSLTAGSGANTVGLDSGGTNPALYAGSATPGSAPFRVTKTGDLTATSATISGAITASSGGISGNFYVGSDVGASGNLYVGSNADIRLSGDGIRLVLPNLAAPSLATMVPTNSSALRWFSNIGSSWTNAANYTGQVSYRDTTNKVVDWDAISFVGSTDYATYYARSMLYACRYNGSTYKECRVEATVDPGAGGAYVTATCDTFYTSADAYIGDDIYIVDNCSALSFTDRTPHYDGDALADLRQVRGDRRRGIDHDSLPRFARRQVRLKDGAIEEGRDLGAMISILTVAVQQLDARLDALEGRGNGRQ